MTDTDLSREKIEAIRAGTEGVQGGPWKLDKFSCYVWAPSEKGGDFPLMDEPGEDGRVARLRGWGYYTGNGNGALGLSRDDALRRQQLTGEHIARLDPATVNALCDLALEALDRRSAPSTAVGVKGLVWKGSNYADTPFGEYTIDLDEDDDVAATPWCAWSPAADGTNLGHFSTVTEAQAAAQADYDARIRAALSPPVEAEPVALEHMAPADDEAIAWITHNLMALRRDSGEMLYRLVQVVRAFQAGKESATPQPSGLDLDMVMVPRASIEALRKRLGDSLDADFDLWSARHNARLRDIIYPIWRDELPAMLAAAGGSNG